MFTNADIKTGSFGPLSLVSSARKRGLEPSTILNKRLVAENQQVAPDPAFSEGQYDSAPEHAHQIRWLGADSGEPGQGGGGRAVVPGLHRRRSEHAIWIRWLGADFGE